MIVIAIWTLFRKREWLHYAGVTVGLLAAATFWEFMERMMV